VRFRFRVATADQGDAMWLVDDVRLFACAKGPSDPGTVQFIPAKRLVPEGATSVTVTVFRTGGLAGGGSVDYTTSDGTATAGNQYTTTTGTLSFDQGVTRQTITVPLTPNNVAEGDKTFNITLSNPQGGLALGASASMVVTIHDKDKGGTV